MMLQTVPMIITDPMMKSIQYRVFLTFSGWQQNSVQLEMNPDPVQLVYEMQGWGSKPSQSYGGISMACLV